MDSRKHSLGLIIRLIIVLAILMCFPLAGRFAESGQLWFTYLVITLVVVVLTIELVFYLNRTNRELTRFLEHIRNRDFNLRFNEQESRGDRQKLYKTFNEVLQVYSDIRIEKEIQFRFLEHIVELIEIGIIVFNQEDKVVLANTASGNITGVPALRSWEHLSKKNPALYAAIGSLRDSKQLLYESDPGPEVQRLAIQVSRTNMLNESYSLVAIQDVKGMVEHKETGAWIRLLRTLNHEIKNSVTPISSLTESLMMILQKEEGKFKTLADLDSQNLADINLSVETLQQRSNKLCAFIDEYHQLTRLPAPDPELILCLSIFKDLIALFKNEMGNISLRIHHLPEDRNLEIRADRSMIDQILINLIKNSFDAVKDRQDPEIILGFRSSVDEVIFSIRDNGTGIEKEIMEDIFVPFFSTKSLGSGIGLSLVRQLMRLHGGKVQITSEVGVGTMVSLIFIKTAV